MDGCTVYKDRVQHFLMLSIPLYRLLIKKTFIQTVKADIYGRSDKAYFPSDGINRKWTNSVALSGHLISLGTFF
jgi:hypothetical protein